MERALARTQWQWLYDQARRLPQRIGYHPTCNEVRNWLSELMANDGFDVDWYNQVRDIPTRRCADCGKVIPADQELCNCDVSGDLGGD